MPRLTDLIAAPDLRSAKAVVMLAATQNDHETLLAMLGCALSQLERTAPPVDGHVWEAYAAVLMTGLEQESPREDPTT